MQEARGPCRFVSSCNGKAPSRSSRAAREWYGRRPARDASTLARPSLCAASRFLLRLCQFDRCSISPGRENVKAPAPPMDGKTAPPSTGAGRPSPLADPGVGLPGEDQVVHVLGRIPRGLGPFVFLHHNRSFFHTYSLPIQISICGRGRVHDRIFSLTPGGDSPLPGPPASPRGPWGHRAPLPAPLPGQPAPSGGRGPPPAPRRWR